MKNKAIFYIMTIITLSSCTQLRQFAALTKCEFRTTTMEKTTLAGIDVQGVKSLKEIKLTEAAKLTTAVAKKNVPLSFTLNIEAKNPNSSKAAINKIEWIALIDDQQLTTGVVNKRVEIEANSGVATIPININANLSEVFSGETGKSVLNFGFNLVGAGDEPSRVTLKIKPTILIGSYPLSYPGYITLSKTFNAN